MLIPKLEQVRLRINCHIILKLLSVKARGIQRQLRAVLCETYGMSSVDS